MAVEKEVPPQHDRGNNIKQAVVFTLLFIVICLGASWLA